jgi:hypothetical protein
MHALSNVLRFVFGRALALLLDKHIQSRQPQEEKGKIG